MKAGLNLFSVRSLIQDEDSLYKVCLQAKEDGYDYFQFSGMAYDAELLKRVQNAVGCPFVLTHMPMDRILNDTKALVEEHLSFGCTNIGLGAMPLDIIQDEEKCLDTMHRLNEAGKRMQQMGAKFFYHFHHFEFKKLSSGKTIVDYMIENCPYIHFTADTYWIQYGGGDVCAYLNKMKGRIACIHLKDYKIVVSDRGEFTPTFAPVGEGNIDFASVVEVARACGTEYFLVEQDNASAFDDPMAQAKISIDYIKANL